MTSQELIDNGWVQRECKIGTLYFKGDFFGKLQGDVFEMRSMRDDMSSIGTAKTFEDIREIQKKYYQKEVKDYEILLGMAKFKLKQFE
jgi:hypothetical protein